MPKSEPTSHLKLHSSAPNEFERWKASVSYDAATKPLTRDIVERALGLLGGRICGRCGKKITYQEGKARMVPGEIVDHPELGPVQLPDHPSQYRYCPRCFDVLENDGKPNLKLAREEPWKPK